jgi:hypothetical protein
VANASWTEINSWLDDEVKELMISIRRLDQEPDSEKWIATIKILHKPRRMLEATGNSIQQVLSRLKVKYEE